MRLPFVDALEPCLGDLHPMARLGLAFLEEGDELLGAYIRSEGIYVEATHAVHYNLRGSSVTRRKCRQATCHSFNDCQPKCFIQGRLCR